MIPIGRSVVTAAIVLQLPACGLQSTIYEPGPPADSRPQVNTRLLVRVTTATGCPPKVACGGPPVRRSYEGVAIKLVGDTLILRNESDWNEMRVSLAKAERIQVARGRTISGKAVVGYTLVGTAAGAMLGGLIGYGFTEVFDVFDQKDAASEGVKGAAIGAAVGSAIGLTKALFEKTPAWHDISVDELRGEIQSIAR